MAAFSNGADYTAEELEYLNNQGNIPDRSDPEPAKDETTAQPETAETEDPADADPDVAESEANDDGEGAEQEDGRRKPRRVNYGAFAKQKAEAAEARKQLQEAQARFEAREREIAVQNARIEERFRAWNEVQARQAQQNAPQPEAPAGPPNPEENPIEALKWLQQQTVEVQQRQQQYAEQARQTTAIRQLDDAYRMDNHQAAKELPDYPAAYNYMVQLAERTAQIQNPAWTPQQVKAHVEMQERQLAAAAYQQRRRPAQMIYEMARIQGYQPPSAQQAAQAPAQPDPEAEQAKIDAVARGQAQNRSLSSAGRPGASTASMTLEKFVNLSDEEARSWMHQNPDAYARLGGGR